MSKIVAVSSFRRGTGKSNLTANLAALIATTGRRVCVVDMNLQSASIHILFDLEEEDMTHTLDEYLLRQCSLDQIVYDVTPQVTDDLAGKIFLVPLHARASKIAPILRQEDHLNALETGLRALIKRLELDMLIIDTYAGLNEETLFSVGISDTLLLLMRLDHQDYQGTGIMLDLARTLNVAHLALIVNEVPTYLDSERVEDQITRNYDCDETTILYHSEELMALGSAALFVLRYPQHSLTKRLKGIVARLLA